MCFAPYFPLFLTVTAPEQPGKECILFKKNTISE